MSLPYEGMTAAQAIAELRRRDETIERLLLRIDQLKGGLNQLHRRCQRAEGAVQRLRARSGRSAGRALLAADNERLMAGLSDLAGRTLRLLGGPTPGQDEEGPLEVMLQSTEGRGGE